MRCSAGGVSSDRIRFAGRMGRQQYLAMYHQIDIGLDTIPYNGHTTTLDAFWMGVPVITLVGSAPAGRAGWSQLNNLRLTDLAAASPAQLTRIATALSADSQRLQSLRQTLRDRLAASPLMGRGPDLQRVSRRRTGRSGIHDDAPRVRSSLPPPLRRPRPWLISCVAARGIR